jgi:hypothetical protein
MVDLNALIVPGSSMYVSAALLINDLGDIGCLGKDPGDTVDHACLLIPCDENHPGIEGCDYSLVEAVASADVRPALATQTDTSAGSPDKLSQAEIK